MMPTKGHEKFIGHVCEPFRNDDEIALCVRNRISAIVSERHPDLEQANKNLSSGFCSVRRNRILMILLMLLMGTGYMIYSFRGVSSLRSLYENGFFYMGEDISLIDEYPHLNEEEKFVLFGDLKAKNQLEASQSRWQRDLDNASYYIEYLHEFWSENEEYPDNIIAYGDKIDPENSFYRLYSMGNSSFEESVIDKKYFDPYENETREETRARKKREKEEKLSKKKGEKEDTALIKVPTEPEMMILNPQKFEEAVELLFEAANKNVFTTHLDELMSERIPLLNTERETLYDYVVPVIYMSQSSEPLFKVSRGAKIIIAEAQRCGRDKDVEALMKLVQAYENISKQLLARENVTLIHALIVRGYIHRVLPHFRDAAGACGLIELEKKYADLFDVFENDKAHREAISTSTKLEDLLKYGSLISSYSLPLIYNQIGDQSVISPLNHEPLRKAEHAIFSRFATAASWLLFLVVAALISIVNRCKNRVVRTTSMKLLGVLAVKDWLLVLLLGIMVPVALFYYLDRYSLWNITEYNVVYSEAIHSIFRVCVLIMLLLCSQLLVLEWRVGRVTDKVFGKQHVWLVWIALALSLVPLFMLHVIADSSEHIEWYMTLGMSLFLLISFALLRFLPGLFSYKNSVVSRAIVLSLVLSATVLTLLMPIYKAACTNEW